MSQKWNEQKFIISSMTTLHLFQTRSTFFQDGGICPRVNRGHSFFEKSYLRFHGQRQKRPKSDFQSQFSM